MFLALFKCLWLRKMGKLRTCVQLHEQQIEEIRDWTERQLKVVLFMGDLALKLRPAHSFERCLRVSCASFLQTKQFNYDNFEFDDSDVTHWCDHCSVAVKQQRNEVQRTKKKKMIFLFFTSHCFAGCYRFPRRVNAIVRCWPQTMRDFHFISHSTSSLSKLKMWKEIWRRRVRHDEWENKSRLS